MTKIVKYWTLIPSLITAINLVLISFGVYHLDNPQLQSLDVLVSAIGTLLGIPTTHVTTVPDKPPEQ